MVEQGHMVLSIDTPVAVAHKPYVMHMKKAASVLDIGSCQAHWMDWEPVVVATVTKKSRAH